MDTWTHRHIDRQRKRKRERKMDHESLKVMLLSQDAKLPEINTPGSIGYDLSSAQDLLVPAHGRVLVLTNIAVQLPVGTYGRIAPRSGLALKHSVDVAAGVIDPGYTGDIGVVLVNHADDAFSVRKHDRIAQLILEVAVVVPVEVVTVLDGLPGTSRGQNGFGSSGR